jgi:hypothetical protein
VLTEPKEDEPLTGTELETVEIGTDEEADAKNPEAEAEAVVEKTPDNEAEAEPKLTGTDE